MPGAAVSRFTDEQKRAAVAAAVRGVSAGVSQAVATRDAGAPIGVSGRTVQRWAVAQGTPLSRDIEPVRRAVVNAARSGLVVTVQRQRDAVQRLLQIVDVGVVELHRQARQAAKEVDWPLVSRMAHTLAELHTLDNALMLQVGRFDASLSAEENERRAAGRTQDEIAEYAEQWRRDLDKFGGQA
jgi:hypothetical protein